jgi:putative nucleotidyltransferase with HDIG domain
VITRALFHTPSVLVVEDEAALRQQTCAWVDGFGYHAREADSAARALVALDEQVSEIAICDVRLGGGRRNGLWLASQIRDRFPDTAVIMVTAGRDVEIAVASLRNQVVDYLLKPFDERRLDEALALGRDWHHAAIAAEGLQHALQDRLRARRATVAAALAEAQDTPQQALEGLMAILQLHERDARGHAMRVARLAVAIGDEMGFTDDELEALEQGGLLHDIGKLDMPASILSKPGPLDENEWRIMRTHPQVGYDLLRSQPRFADVAEMVLAHHEAYDGSGYPRRLASTRIPKGARVLAVADAYDSMTHPHTQRPAMPPSLAVEEIARCSGKQFDPRCAEALGTVLAHALESETHAAV